MDDSQDPLWLDRSFLLQVLQSVEGNEQELDVLKHSCRPAMDAGINYMSQLYRVSIDYKTGQKDDTNSITVIVKLPLKSGVIKEYLESIGGYKNEVKIYREFLPVMFGLHSCQLTAKSFNCPLNNSLVLEDLRVLGYNLANRLNQLDFAHCRLSLMTLARFHALSVAVYYRQPDLIQNIGREGLFTSDKYKEGEFLKSSLNAMLSTAVKLDECKKYVEMIRKSVDNSDKIVENILKPTSLNGLKVLSHGDVSINNILFKYEADEVVDAKLIDFQMSKYGSFAHDVVYFWWSSANEEVREYHREELFEVYRQTLNQMLEELECSERLSKHELNEGVKAYSPFALHIISVLLPIIMTDPDNLVDFNKDHEDYEQHNIEHSDMMKTYNSKYYKVVLPKVLEQLEAFGAFIL